MDVDRRGYRCPTQWFMTIPPYGQLTQVLTCLDWLSESKMTQDRPCSGCDTSVARATLPHCVSLSMPSHGLEIRSSKRLMGDGISLPLTFTQTRKAKLIWGLAAFKKKTPNPANQRIRRNCTNGQVQRQALECGSIIFAWRIELVKVHHLG